MWVEANGKWRSVLKKVNKGWNKTMTVYLILYHCKMYIYFINISLRKSLYCKQQNCIEIKNSRTIMDYLLFLKSKGKILLELIKPNTIIILFHLLAHTVKRFFGPLPTQNMFKPKFWKLLFADKQNIIKWHFMQ